MNVYKRWSRNPNPFRVWDEYDKYYERWTLNGLML